MKEDKAFNHLLRMVEEKAGQCKTSAEVREQLDNMPSATLATKIYRERLAELVELEAIEKARQCTTADEVWELVEGADPRSLRKEIYWSRYKELVELEAREEAAQCTTASEARELWNSGPGKNQNFYGERLRELTDKEAPQKAAQCTTATEVLMLLKETGLGSLAKRTYEKRWMTLFLEGK